MLEEMKAIKENETWELVYSPPRCRPIGLKWVYKVKRDERGDIVKRGEGTGASLVVWAT